MVGQTATGKSDLAVELARIVGGEVVSADSRQVYRGLDIGSGKITKKEMRGIPHHLLDVASPRRIFTVAQYQKKARAAVAGIISRAAVPIVCGGTGMYVDALTRGQIFPAINPNPRLRKELSRKSVGELFELLKKRDPRRAKTIDPFNRVRLIRALEIIHETGQAVPTLAHRDNFWDVLYIGLAQPETALRIRIHARLIRRIRGGMTAEVRRLHEKDGVSWARLEALGLEYRYVSRYLRGMISRNETIATLDKEIYRYAKRQTTWFARNKEIVWVKNTAEAVAVVEAFLVKKN